ncbi:hypothetical protein ACTA71_009356 [Dictyostelium dimigraforme]
MAYKLILTLSILFSFFLTVYSVGSPSPYDVKFDNGSLIYIYYKNSPYFTRFILFQDLTTPRSEMAQNYFDCSKVDDKYRYCVFYPGVPLSRVWGTSSSTGCARDVSNPTEDCENYLIETAGKIPQPQDVVINRHPPTSGGDILISGYFLRLLGGPNSLQNSISSSRPFTVYGNFSDPSFNCNNITVKIPSGSGNFKFYFDDLGLAIYPFSFASPIISNVTVDSSNKIITINGDNFFTKTTLVQLYFDGIIQSNLNITEDHKQIQLNNFNRVDPGPLSIGITINEVSADKNYIYCFPAIITSISSVSNHLGGTVTIKGSKLSSTLNSTLIPTITIGDQQCTFIKSTSNELECQLNSIESSGKDLVELPINVNFGGCNSTNSGVTFTYGLPTLSSASYSNGNVTLNGTNFGKKNESSVQIGNEIIELIDVSPDEKVAIFKLPPLRCKQINITFIHNNIISNQISISPPLKTKVLNSPAVTNGILQIELYYIDCQNDLLTTPQPSIIVGNSSANQCSNITLSQPSEFYQTNCPTPFGTGANKAFVFKYNMEEVDDMFTHAPPIVTSCPTNQISINITGSNFGNTTSLLQITLNGIDVSSNIMETKDNQLTLKRENSYKNGPLNITVDGIKMGKPFDLALPPLISNISNLNDLTLNCGGFVTIVGQYLNTNEPFHVRVLANNQPTEVISTKEMEIIVKATNTKYNQANITTFIDITNKTVINGPEKMLKYFDPIITVVPSILKRSGDVIFFKIGGISFSDLIKVQININGELLPVNCILNCRNSSGDEYYNEIKNTPGFTPGSEESEIKEPMDTMSCNLNYSGEGKIGMLYVNLFPQNVTIIRDPTPTPTDNTQPNNIKPNNNKSGLSTGAIVGVVIGCVGFVLIIVQRTTRYPKVFAPKFQSIKGKPLLSTKSIYNFQTTLDLNNSNNNNTSIHQQQHTNTPTPIESLKIFKKGDK